MLLLGFLILAFGIWVFADCIRITGSAGRAFGWALGCFFLWLIFIPIYLCRRPGIKREAQQRPMIEKANSSNDAYSKLEKLARLKANGAITSSEYEEKKKVLVNSL